MLAGVARNRATVVERVELTDAELPLGYGSTTEPTMTLRFNWIEGVDVATAPFSEAALRAAGFDLPPAGPGPLNQPPPLPHVAVVALDIGGPSHEHYLDSFYAHAVGQASAPASQLVVVDVGRDLASMRRAHPDPAHTLVLYALVAAVRSVGADGHWTWRGSVSALEPMSLTVPRDMRPALEPRPPDNRFRYTVTLAVGAQGEPWIERVRPR